MSARFIDLTGIRIERFTVINLIDPVYVQYKNGKVKKNYWLCKCDCGNVFSKLAAHIKTTKNCPDCSNKNKITTPNMVRALREYNKRQHDAASKYPRLKTIWYRMIDRCYNVNHISFKSYGLKGIAVCDKWKHSFKEFEDWAVLNGYKDNLSIDRIKSSGNYEPSNCRWATKLEQSNNRRDNVRLIYYGEPITIGNLARKLNLPYSLLYSQIYKNRFIDGLERAAS